MGPEYHWDREDQGDPEAIPKHLGAVAFVVDVMPLTLVVGMTIATFGAGGTLVAFAIVVIRVAFAIVVIRVTVVIRVAFLHLVLPQDLNFAGLTACGPSSDGPITRHQSLWCVPPFVSLAARTSLLG
jgi:hypothetical protein